MNLLKGLCRYRDIGLFLILTAVYLNLITKLIRHSLNATVISFLTIASLVPAIAGIILVIVYIRGKPQDEPYSEALDAFPDNLEEKIPIK